MSHFDIFFDTSIGRLATSFMQSVSNKFLVNVNI